MAGTNKKSGVHLHERLSELEAQGKIPTVERGIIQQLRWQWKEYPSGVHYGAPTDPKEMGRYNDPTSKTGVCYTADYAVVAIAESLGRDYQKSPEDFILGYAELDKAQLYTLETTRVTKTIDMSRLAAILHITADKLKAEDYCITQSVTDWVANHSANGYDGITYSSRHLENAGTCTAFFNRKGVSAPLADVSHKSVNLYVSHQRPDYPSGWEATDISGFEIVTETLHYDVSDSG